MKYNTLALCLCLTLSTAIFAAPQKAAATDETKKEKTVETKDVKIKNLTLKIPTAWAVQKGTTTNRMRLATYHVKPVEGEKDNAELTVFNFGTQGIKANIDRWIGQFSSEGRKSKVSKGSCPTGEYYFVDISGTYKKPKPGAGPFGEKVDAEDYRMLGIVLPVKGDGMYFLKFAGPDKTVAGQAKALRGAFGGKKAEEKAQD